MKILIIGGTLFLGRHLVETALLRGHQLTLFNRGRTNPSLFPHVERVIGDRTSDLHLLRDRRWDAVIDTCGYVPGVVQESAECLRQVAGHYTFVSSISVYSHPMEHGTNEGAPVQNLDRALADEFKPEHYGALKVLCEEALTTSFGENALVVRSGLLVGPHDPTGRLGYWIRRLADGANVLAPGRPTRQVQLIDARDMADWILRMAEDGKAGTFNVTGPADPLTMEDLLVRISTGLRSSANLTWVPDDFLASHGVAPWTELPIWLPDKLNGMLAVSIEKGLKAGLSIRPLAETIRDTVDWMTTDSAPDRVLASGVGKEQELSRARESELLHLWCEKHVS